MHSVEEKMKNKSNVPETAGEVPFRLFQRMQKQKTPSVDMNQVVGKQDIFIPMSGYPAV